LLKKYIPVAARIVFALFYFYVGVKWFALHGLGDPVKDAVAASTVLESAMAQSRFMNPLLAFGCLLGGAALFFRRTAPLGIVLLAPIVIIIFFFHLVVTGIWPWGALHLIWLTALAWHFRRGFDPLWNYPQRAPH